MHHCHSSLIMKRCNAKTRLLCLLALCSLVVSLPLILIQLREHAARVVPQAESSPSQQSACSMSLTARTNISRDAYTQKVQGKDLALLMDLVDAFSLALTRANVTFFLYSGSLIGSWRHHGLVPWDDDVDFAVQNLKKQAARAALNNLKKPFKLSVKQKVRWKVFSEDSQRIKGSSVEWSWPFLDISFFMENATHVWDRDRNFPQFNFLKAHVFPLKFRPFQGRLVPVPAKCKQVLAASYNVSQCQPGIYNHRTERWANRKKHAGDSSISCRDLKRCFPFVERRPARDSYHRPVCVETLVDRGQVTSWHVEDEPC